jgi:hypothetical protein
MNSTRPLVIIWALSLMLAAPAVAQQAAPKPLVITAANLMADDARHQATSSSTG